MKTHSKSFIQALWDSGVARTIPFHGVEIGVWKGENSMELLREFEHLHLYMIDRYLELTPEEKKVHKRTGKLDQKEMDLVWKKALERTSFANSRREMLVMTSVEAASHILDSDLSFVFIDASHDYENVRRDIALWDPKVKSGGVVGGHDYGGRGDRKGTFGVKRAVDEYYGEERVNTAPGLVWWVQK